MTLIDIQNTLYSHFLRSDSFIMERDLDSINVYGNQESVSNDEKADLDKVKASLIRLALEQLEKGDYVRRVTDDYYILRAPLGNSPQAVVIPADLANIICDLVNEWLSVETGDSDDKTKGVTTRSSDKTNISTYEIEQLVGIVFDLMEENKEEDDDDDAKK